MKLLFIGDIVGKTGRKAVEEQLSSLKKQYAIDVVIANAENSAHGKGITEKIYHELIAMGIDYITLGNHAFSKEDIKTFIDSSDRLVRPLNLYPLEYGKGYLDFKFKQKKYRLINLCGAVFMDNIADNPFTSMQNLINDASVDACIVDFHAEVTSEKSAFLHLFHKKCSLIVGTHTHVQTADELIYEGCAYISDVGMTGPYHSIIGRDITEVLNRFRGQVTKTFTVASGPAILSAIVVEIDDEDCQAKRIERIQIRPNNLDSYR